MLDRVRSGIFAAVHLAPHASTWARVRHAALQGQRPLRSRQQPLGLSELHPEAHDKVLQSNAELEVCCWFLEQAAQCAFRSVWVLMVFPEDLGGDAETGQASIWDLQEVRAIDSINDIQRGAAFHCQLAGSNQRRPLDLYTNLDSLLSRMHRGWPLLSLQHTKLQYSGPLPPSCPCSQAHPPLKGVDQREEFHSSSSTALGEQFWWWSLVPHLQPENAPLGMRVQLEQPSSRFLGSSFLLSLRYSLCHSHVPLWLTLRHPNPRSSPTGATGPYPGHSWQTTWGIGGFAVFPRRLVGLSGTRLQGYGRRLTAGIDYVFKHTRKYGRGCATWTRRKLIRKSLQSLSTWQGACSCNVQAALGQVT